MCLVELTRKEKKETWGEKPLVGVVGGDGVGAVERLQDPGDAADLPVQVRPWPPLLSQRLQVLGRHLLPSSLFHQAPREESPECGEEELKNTPQLMVTFFC